jgi:hypothetical protein
VRGANARGQGQLSGPAGVIVGTPAPAVLVHLSHTIAGQLNVVFVPGAESGDAISAFTATCTSTNGGGPKSASTTTGSPITVTGLTVGKAYSCYVTETNGRGIGNASARTGVTGA